MRFQLMKTDEKKDLPLYIQITHQVHVKLGSITRMLPGSIN